MSISVGFLEVDMLIDKLINLNFGGKIISYVKSTTGKH